MFGNPFDLRDELKTENKSAPDPFGRLGVDDEPDTEIAEIKNPTALKAPVGDTGQNSRRDVAKTEQLLGQAGTLDLKKTDGPTGYWGTRTSHATKAFQKQNGLKVDGQINPGGETIRALGKLAGQAVKSVTQPKTKGSRHPRAGEKPNTELKNRHPREGGDLFNEGAEKESRLRGNDNGDGVLKLTEDAFSENQRAARYLASRDGIGEFSKFVADGIETDGEKAIAETVDLYHQTAEMNQVQADALINKVLPSLSSENAKRLQSAIMPIQDEPKHNPLDLGNLSDVLENVRQKREAESALFDRLQGDAGEKDNQQQKSAPSLDERTKDTFGLKADIERPQGILPMPDKKDGTWHEPGDRDWTSWTAPEWVHEGAKAVALPKHILDGGAWSEADATKAALAIGAGSAVGKVVRGKKPLPPVHMAFRESIAV